jgi:hypothetical protein
MLVICNGLPRSASTWSYIVAMRLLRGATGAQTHGGYDENIYRFMRDLPASAAHAVLKCHGMDAAGLGLSQLHAARVIYTWRDLKDATASFMAMFGADFDHTFAVMSNSLDLYARHRASGALILGYPEILQDGPTAVARIADYLGLAAEREMVESVAEGASLARTRERVDLIGSIDYGDRLIRHEQSLYDPETLLHVDHVRNGGIGYGAEALNEAQRRRIDRLAQDKGLMPG